VKFLEVILEAKGSKYTQKFWTITVIYRSGARKLEKFDPRSSDLGYLGLC
jgi:hypothetical protein